MRRINVLELTTTLEVGGTERMLSYLARGLNKKKFNVTVACLTHGGVIADELRRDGVDVCPLNMKSKLDVEGVCRLYRLLKEKKVGILHTYLFHANFLGRIVGKLAGVPVIVSSERIMGLEGRHRLFLNRLTAPLADAFTTNANAVKEFMVEEIGLPRKKIEVIHNGVDLIRFDVNIDREKMRRTLGVKPDDIVCVTVARLDEQKGISYLIEAAKRIIEEKPETRFLIVGDGPLRVELEELSRKLGLTKNVFFLGLREDVPQILKASDLFVLPSLWEGFPNVVLEAMAASLPVVATKTSGTPEAVVDGETGLLVEAGDADGLADTLMSVISNKKKREVMGFGGRERVETVFSIENMISENERLYDMLVKQKRWVGLNEHCKDDS